jgi:hypothetical protein
VPGQGSKYPPGAHHAALAGTDSNGLPRCGPVDFICHSLEELSHQERRNPAGHFYDINSSPHVATGFLERLAVFPGYQTSERFKVPFQKLSVSEQNARSLASDAGAQRPAEIDIIFYLRT